MAIYLFDVDGPLCDFTPPILEALKPFGCTLTVDDITIFDFIKLMLTETQRREAWRLCGDSDWWAALPPTPHAAEVVNKVLEHDHKVVFVSSPWASCKGWEHARRKWLADNLAIDQRTVNFMSVPSELKHIVDGDVFIEDRHSTLEAWEQHQDINSQGPGIGYLYQAPHNAKDRWPNDRRISWDVETRGRAHMLHIDVD